MTGLVVYVAGPYSSDPAAGANAAALAAHALLDAGHYPVVPHLSLLLDLVRHRPYEEWLRHDFALLRRCDALLRLPGHSPGADREVQEAERLGVSVVHSIEEL